MCANHEPMGNQTSRRSIASKFGCRAVQWGKSAAASGDEPRARQAAAHVVLRDKGIEAGDAHPQRHGRVRQVHRPERVLGVKGRGLEAGQALEPALAEVEIEGLAKKLEGDCCWAVPN